MEKQSIELGCSKATADALRDLFVEMARAYEAKAKEQEAESRDIPPGYIKNAKGWMLPVEQASQRDLLESSFVDGFHLLVEAMAAGCEHVRLSAFSEASSLVSMVVADAGGNGATAQAMGKTTLLNYPATRRITIDRRDTVAFGPEEAAARDLAMACIRKWDAGSNKHIVALANLAFQTNSGGELSVSKVAALWRIECDDEDWQAAMAALKSAIRTTGVSTYLRFHERKAPDGKWSLIEAHV
jgi:hypothetical protein